MRLTSNPYDWSRVNLNLFYGRDKELRGILRDLERGKSCAMVGGRRIGKTTLLRKLETELGKQLLKGFNQGFVTLPVYVDMSTLPTIANPAIVYRRILEEAEQRFRDSGLLDVKETCVTLVQQFAGEESRGFREALLSLVRRAADRCGIRIVVMLDEIEKIVVAEWGQTFCDNWRAWLSNDPPLSDHHSIVLVMAGAREMAAISRDLGSPLSNVMSWKEILLLSHDAGRELINEPTKSVLDAATVDEIVRQTDAHPWLVQYLMEYLCDFDLSEANVRLVEALDKFFKEQSGQFRYWWDLKLNGNDRRIYALLADRHGWVLKRDVINEVGDTAAWQGLAVLCHTGIVRKAGTERVEQYRVAGEMFLRWFKDHATFDASLTPHDCTIEAKLRALRPDLAHKYVSAWVILQAEFPEYSAAADAIRGVFALVLDELAPSEEVISQPGYQPTQDERGQPRKRPTQAQRVRFIARHKALGHSADITKEVALFETLLQQLGQVARASYSRASGYGHTVANREQAWRCLKQLDSILAQLL